MLRQFSCPLCSWQVAFAMQAILPGRKHLLSCKGCGRNYLLFASLNPPSQDQDFVPPPAPSFEAFHARLPDTPLHHTSVPKFSPADPPLTSELPKSPPPAASFLEIESPQADMPAENIEKANENELREFLAAELGEKNKLELKQAKTADTSQHIQKLKNFLEKEFQAEIEIPPSAFLEPPTIQENVTKPAKTLAPKKTRAPRPHAPWQQRMRTLTLVLLAVPQAIIDFLAMKPFDLLANLHLAFGREWARIWKRLSWLLTPFFCLAALIVLFPKLTQNERLFLTSGLILTCLASLFFFVCLGLSWINRAFHGEASRFWIRVCILPVLGLQTLLAIRVLPGWMKKNEARLERLNPFADSTKVKSISIFIEKLANLAHNGENKISTKTREILPSRELSGNAFSVPPLDETTRTLGKSFLRAEMPDLAKEDLLGLSAQVLLERSGPQAFQGTPEGVSARLRAVMLKDFPYLLKPEAIRNEGVSVEPVEISAPESSKDLLSDANFRNALTTLTYGVKWRHIEQVHKTLPSILHARLTPADIGRFYAALFSIGEIFTMESQVMSETSNAILVQTDYFMVPYIKINPEEVLFQSGAYESMKRQNPVKVAQIFYLFVQEENGWRAIHFTPATAQMLSQLYPQLKLPGVPADMNIRTQSEMAAPKDVVRPQIQ